MAHHTHDLDIYPVRLHLITRHKDRQKVGQALSAEDGDFNCAGFALSTLDRDTRLLHVTVWVDAKWHRKHDRDLQATVVHEAAHAGGMILDHFGQRYDGESEALAYLVEWIAVWLGGCLT